MRRKADAPQQDATPAAKPIRRSRVAPLLDWYRRNRRRLPWRATADPYAIWVAEVMLQQTTVKTVLPYYESFLERFPSVETLAGATEHDVLAAWTGLGYYHRPRNLLRGARYLCEHHAGRFPEHLPAALAVPGVGLYTASAVLSIAYRKPLPVVDGNVRRVLARLFALHGPQWHTDGPFYNLAADLLDPAAPGDWNQALMELGATVCTPRDPACPACPLASACEARRLGTQDSLPERRTRRAPLPVTVAAALIESDGRFLIVRRDGDVVLKDLWEVPQTSLDSKGRIDLERELEERHGLAIRVGALLAVVRHAITFRRIRVEVYAAGLLRPARVSAGRLAWATADEIARLPSSSMTRKILRALEPGQRLLDLQ
jgi:A/G-specific adenine glycosylase